MRPPTSGEKNWKKKFRALENALLPEVPDARERRQAVVEADHHAEGRDRVPEHVLGDESHHRVEHRRDDTGDDRRVARGEELRVHLRELRRQRAVVTHREQGPRGETNVDCSEAAEHDSTAIDTRIASGPRMGPASAKNTLPWMSSLPSPTRRRRRPRSHEATDEEQVEDDDDDDRRRGGAAGRRSRTLRLLAHRQGDVPAPEDEDREREAGGEGENEPTANGLNQSSEIGRASNAPTARDVRERDDGEQHHHEQLEAHEQYCSFWVVCMSRYEMSVAPSMNDQTGDDVDDGFDARSAMSGFWKICDSIR